MKGGCMRKMISFSKVLCSFLTMLLFIAYLSGCCGVESTTDSETIKTGSIDVSSITENTDSVLPTPSPSTAPETYDIKPIEKTELLGMFPANDAVVVIGNGTHITIEGVLLNDIVDLEQRAKIEYSADKEEIGLVFQERNGQSDVLVFSDGKDAVDVANNVDDFTISEDGSRIAYRVCGDDWKVGELYIFDRETGESTLIEEQAGLWYVLSPEGRAIAYMKIDYLNSTETEKLYYGVIGGEIKAYSRNDRVDWPVGLTDDAALVYVLSSNSANEKRDTIGVYIQGDYSVYRSEPPFGSITFNRDATEVMFYDESGIWYSAQGDEPILLEPAMNHTVISATGYQNTDHLYNRLYLLTDQPETKSLWYFDEQGVGRRILSMPMGEKPHEYSFEQVGNSVLFANIETILFADNINDPANMENVEISRYCEKPYFTDQESEVLLSSSKNIYYYSNAGVLEKDRFDVGAPREMSVVYSEDRNEPRVLSNNCVWIDLLHREGQVDIIYFLERRAPQTPKDEYIAWKYSNLYMIEDIPGAEPVLLAENVSEIGIGEFGVYYVRLNKAGPGALDFFKDLNKTGSLRDTVDVNLSSDGQNFEKITTVGREYLLWSGS